MAKAEYVLPLHYTEASEAFAKVKSGEWDAAKLEEWVDACKEEADSNGYDRGHCDASDTYEGGL